MKTHLITGGEIKGLLNIKETIEVVERAFKEKGLSRVQMPPKPFIFFPRYEGDLRIMPCYLEALELAGVKIVNAHPRNPEKFGMPAVTAVIVLVDPKTGFPYAIMDGTWITAMRTGAAGAVAAKYLAREDCEIAGFVGAGVQATTQLLGLKEVLDLKQAHVWSQEPQTIEKFRGAAEPLGIKVIAVKTIEEAVREKDIVTTATPSREPLVKSQWIKPGTHINAIGADAPGKEELEPEILIKAKVVIDDWEQASHSGEINVPLKKGIITRDNIWAELGEVLTGKKGGRASEDEITVFDSTGLSIQDIVTANLVYQKAKEKNIGFELNLISFP